MKLPFASDEKFKKSVNDGLELLGKSQAKDGGVLYGKNPSSAPHIPGEPPACCRGLPH